MTNVEKAIQHQIRVNMGYSDIQIAAMEKETEIMNRPDSDPEKIAAIFKKARGI